MTQESAPAGADRTPSDATGQVVVGRIGRPHGVHGEVTVETRTDEPERRFADGTALEVRRPTGQPAAGGPSRLTVTSTRWHQGRLLVRFEELVGRTAAESARGWLLETTVTLDERPEDPEEFYDHQLVGLAVVTTDGRSAGHVAQVQHNGAQDLLVVRREGRADALVPFVTALVPEVDLRARRVVVADRPGLLEPEED